MYFLLFTLWARIVNPRHQGKGLLDLILLIFIIILLIMSHSIKLIFKELFSSVIHI
mgnify:CR=1 FL=1